jgi:hypothetical protein
MVRRSRSPTDSDRQRGGCTPTKLQDNPRSARLSDDVSARRARQPVRADAAPARRARETLGNTPPRFLLRPLGDRARSTIRGARGRPHGPGTRARRYAAAVAVRGGPAAQPPKNRTDLAHGLTLCRPCLRPVRRAGHRRSCALIPGLRAGVPYLRTGPGGVGPAGKSGQPAGSWKCQMTRSGRPPEARPADGR